VIGEQTNQSAKYRIDRMGYGPATSIRREKGREPGFAGRSLHGDRAAYGCQKTQSQFDGRKNPPWGNGGGCKELKLGEEIERKANTAHAKT